MVKLEIKDNSSKIQSLIQKLGKMQVYIGVTEPKAFREGENVNNAQLAYLHTNGSELQHIPARPIIEPVIEKNIDKIIKMLKKAGQTVLNDQDARAEYERIGTFAMNKVKANFTDPDNGWAPNSPLTIALKGSDDPLIDTSSLQKSITYVVTDE